jgi:hypothetical protein
LLRLTAIVQRCLDYRLLPYWVQERKGPDLPLWFVINFHFQLRGLNKNLQWSRLGRPVYLVDKNPTQLTQARQEIEQLRNNAPSPAGSTPRQWGEVIFSPANKLTTSLSKSWLVIEVRLHRQKWRTMNGFTDIPQKVRTTLAVMIL